MTDNDNPPRRIPRRRTRASVPGTTQSGFANAMAAKFQQPGQAEQTPYHHSNRFIDANGVRLHVALDESSRAAAPLLALVNPASHNLTCWEPVLDGLRRRFRVLRFDIRGTGKSGWGADDAFTFSHYADDLAGLLTALNVDRAFVLGVAYGARTAARFALRHPERLTALGLFDVALTPPVEQSGQRELAAQARELLQAAGEPAVAPRKYWRFYETARRRSARTRRTAWKTTPLRNWAASRYQHW